MRQILAGRNINERDQAYPNYYAWYNWLLARPGVERTFQLKAEQMVKNAK